MAQFARLRDLVNTAHLTLGALDGSIVIEPVMAAASEPSDPLGIALPDGMVVAEDYGFWGAAEDALAQAEGDEQEAMQLLQEQGLVEECGACGEWFDPTDVQVAIHEQHVIVRKAKADIEQNRLYERFAGLFPKADWIAMWQLAERVRLGADLPASPVPVAD